MNLELVARRDRAAQRHDRALERWPDRGGGFEAELDAVISELKDVCRRIDPERDAANEAARCWSWLGDAYFDRALGKETGLLGEGRACYERAEALLGPAGDLQQRAKLDYNFANTLRGLSEGANLELLRQAEQRYRRALDVFRSHLPNAVQACETAVASIGQQIRVAEKAAGAVAALAELRKIVSRHDSGDSAGARADLERFKAQNPSAEVLAQGLLQELDAMGALLKLPPEQLSGSKLQLREQLAAILAPKGDSTMTAMLRLLEARLRQDVSSGTVDPQRRRLLEGVLHELRDLAAEAPLDDIAAMAAWLTRMRDLMRRLQEVALHPSLPKPRSSAGERLIERIRALSEMVHKEMLLPHRKDGDAELTNHLLVELVRLRSDVQGLESEDAVVAAEHDRLRPLATQWRKYALRHAMVLAWPDRWMSDPAGVDANAVAWVSRAPMPPEVRELCRRRGMRVLEQGNLDAATTAWDSARRAAVVMAMLDGEREPHWAPVCYQLGLARCAGASVVLLKQPTEVVPFDLEVPPIDLVPGVDLASKLDERLDEAFYRRPALIGRQSTLDATLALARRTLTEGYAPTLLSQLRGPQEADALKVQGVLEQCIGLQGRAAPVLLTPPLPIPYPDPGRPCCFHVTPFRGQFEAIWSVARSACERVGTTYLHGAESQDPAILRAIWNDIGRSSHVLVDLTDLNPNVAFELGIAHALGRHVMCIQRTVDSRPRLFPAIERERVTCYPSTENLGKLSAAIERFLRSRRGV